MRIRFDKDALAYATGATQSIANAQSSLPILASILITAETSGVTFTASDMESCVRCTVQAEVLEPGAIAVPAKTLHSLVRELPEGPVDMELSESLLCVTSGNGRFHLTTQSAEDFPAWPELQEGTSFSVEQAALGRILSHIMFALPQRDPRKHLLGAYFSLKSGELMCIGTDSKKLGLSRCDVSQVSGPQPASAIIPQKILHEVQRNLRGEGSLRVIFGERQVGFVLDNLVYLGNRIDAVAPNYESVIPRHFTREVRLNRVEFLNNIKCAHVVSSERSSPIIMRFEKNRAAFSARTQDVGSFQGSMDVAFDGEPVDIAFNAAYLSDTFRTIESDDVIVKINKNTTPAIFVDPEYDKSLFLIMPIKIREIPEMGER